MLSALSALPPMEPSPGGWASLRAALERPARRTPVWKPAFGLGLASLAVAAVVVAVLALRPAPEPPSTIARPPVRTPAAASVAKPPTSAPVICIAERPHRPQRATAKAPVRVLIAKKHPAAPPTDVANVEADYYDPAGLSAGADRLISDGFSVLAKATEEKGVSEEDKQL